jgi:hypothetical protein
LLDLDVLHSAAACARPLALERSVEIHRALAARHDDVHGSGHVLAVRHLKMSIDGLLAFVAGDTLCCVAA